MSDALTRPSPALATLTATADYLGDRVEILALDSPESEAQAAVLLRAIAACIADAETARKAEKAPHKAEVDRIDGAYAAPRDRLRAVERQLRYRLAQAARDREETRAAATKAALAAPAESNQALATITAVPDTPGVTMIWSWEVDSFDPTRVNPEYLLPAQLNMGLVREVIRVAERVGSDPVLTGVVFRRKATPRVTR